MLPGPTEGGFGRLLNQLLFIPPVSGARSQLVDPAVAVWSRPGFDTFASVSQLRFEPFDHQLRAAAVALRQMAGRAILADEVGLGKTIEAGIVLSSSAPATLPAAPSWSSRPGWSGSGERRLERKFRLPTVVASQQSLGLREAQKPLVEGAVIVASLADARREPLLGALTGREWDLVIVDEGHLARNPRTASSKLVRALRSRFLLLLTATPVENGLDDIYHLVSLVRPGHLGASPISAASTGRSWGTAVAQLAPPYRLPAPRRPWRTCAGGSAAQWCATAVASLR